MSGRTQVTCTCSRGFLKNLLHGQICVCVMCQQGLQATLVFPSSSWFFGRWGCYCAKSAGWCLILTWKHHSHLLKENQVKQQSDELPVPSQQISLCFHSHSEDGWAKTSAQNLSTGAMRKSERFCLELLGAERTEKYQRLFIVATWHPQSIFFLIMPHSKVSSGGTSITTMKTCFLRVVKGQNIQPHS